MADGYYYFDGNTSNYLSSPDSSTFTIGSGRMSIVAYIWPDQWIPTGAMQVVVGKFDYPANQRVFRLALAHDAGPASLQFEWSWDGTNRDQFNRNAGAWANRWVRADFNMVTGAAKMFESTNGTNWTQIGTAGGYLAHSGFHDGTEPIEIGRIGGTADNAYKGRVYTVKIFDGDYGTGRTVTDIDFRNTNMRTGTSPDTWLDSSGNVWTEQGTVAYTNPTGQTASGSLSVSAGPSSSTQIIGSTSSLLADPDFRDQDQGNWLGGTATDSSGNVWQVGGGAYWDSGSAEQKAGTIGDTAGPSAIVITGNKQASASIVVSGKDANTEIIGTVEITAQSGSIVVSGGISTDNDVSVKKAVSFAISDSGGGKGIIFTENAVRMALVVSGGIGTDDDVSGAHDSDVAISVSGGLVGEPFDGGRVTGAQIHVSAGGSPTTTTTHQGNVIVVGSNTSNTTPFTHIAFINASDETISENAFANVNVGGTLIDFGTHPRTTILGGHDPGTTVEGNGSTLRQKHSGGSSLIPLKDTTGYWSAHKNNITYSNIHLDVTGTSSQTSAEAYWVAFSSDMEWIFKFEVDTVASGLDQYLSIYQPFIGGSLYEISITDDGYVSVRIEDTNPYALDTATSSAKISDYASDATPFWLRIVYDGDGETVDFYYSITDGGIADYTAVTWLSLGAQQVMAVPKIGSGWSPLRIYNYGTNMSAKSYVEVMISGGQVVNYLDWTSVSPHASSVTDTSSNQNLWVITGQGEIGYTQAVDLLDLAGNTDGSINGDSAIRTFDRPAIWFPTTSDYENSVETTLIDPIDINVGKIEAEFTFRIEDIESVNGFLEISRASDAWGFLKIHYAHGQGLAVTLNVSTLRMVPDVLLDNNVTYEMRVLIENILDPVTFTRAKVRVWWRPEGYTEWQYSEHGGGNFFGFNSDGEVAAFPTTGITKRLGGYLYSASVKADDNYVLNLKNENINPAETSLYLSDPGSNPEPYAEYFADDWHILDYTRIEIECQYDDWADGNEKWLYCWGETLDTRNYGCWVDGSGYMNFSYYNDGLSQYTTITSTTTLPNLVDTQITAVPTDSRRIWLRFEYHKDLDRAGFEVSINGWGWHALGPKVTNGDTVTLNRDVSEPVRIGTNWDASNSAVSLHVLNVRIMKEYPWEEAFSINFSNTLIGARNIEGNPDTIVNLRNSANMATYGQTFIQDSVPAHLVWSETYQANVYNTKYFTTFLDLLGLNTSYAWAAHNAMPYSNTLEIAWVGSVPDWFFAGGPATFVSKWDESDPSTPLRSWRVGMTATAPFIELDLPGYGVYYHEFDYGSPTMPADQIATVKWTVKPVTSGPLTGQILLSWSWDSCIAEANPDWYSGNEYSDSSFINLGVTDVRDSLARIIIGGQDNATANMLEAEVYHIQIKHDTSLSADPALNVDFKNRLSKIQQHPGDLEFVVSTGQTITLNYPGTQINENGPGYVVYQQGANTFTVERKTTGPSVLIESQPHISLDGTDDTLQISDNSLYDLNPGSALVYYKPRQSPRAEVIMAKTADLAGANGGWAIGYDASGNATAYVADGISTLTSDTIDDSQIVNFINTEVITYDGTNVEVASDGISSLSPTSGTLALNNTDLYVGSSQATNYAAGELYGAGIWNRVLTPTEIRHLARFGIGGWQLPLSQPVKYNDIIEFDFTSDKKESVGAIALSNGDSVRPDHVIQISGTRSYRSPSWAYLPSTPTEFNDFIEVSVNGQSDYFYFLNGIEVEFYGAMQWHGNTGPNIIAARRGTITTETSWEIYISSGSPVMSYWEGAGSSNTQFDPLTPVPFENWESGGLRVSLDFNNGSGGYDFLWETKREGEDWQILHQATIPSGPIGINNPSGVPVRIGSLKGAAQSTNMKVDRFVLRDGPGGNTVIDADFTRQRNDTTVFTDDTTYESIVTIKPDAEIRFDSFDHIYTENGWQHFAISLSNLLDPRFNVITVKKDIPSTRLVSGGIQSDDNVSSVKNTSTSLEVSAGGSVWIDSSATSEVSIIEINEMDFTTGTLSALIDMEWPVGAYATGSILQKQTGTSPPDLNYALEWDPNTSTLTWKYGSASTIYTISHTLAFLSDGQRMQINTDLDTNQDQMHLWYRPYSEEAWVEVAFESGPPSTGPWAANDADLLIMEGLDANLHRLHISLDHTGFVDVNPRGVGRQTRSFYDESGNLAFITLADGAEIEGTGIEVALRTTATYNAAGRLVELVRVYPTGDVFVTGWDTAPTQSESLYTQVDEPGAPSDTDYIHPT